MEDFINAIVKLNKEGTNGFQSFAEQARNSTGGIKTSIANAKTAVTRGVANIIASINEGLSNAGLGGIGEIFGNVGKTAEKWLNFIGEKAKVLIPPIVEFIRNAIDRVRKWMEENKVKEAIQKIAEIVKTIAKQIISFLKPIYEFIKKNIIPAIKDFVKSLIFKIRLTDLEKLKDILNILIPIIAGVVAGFIAFKTVSTIISVISSVKKAFTGLFATISANPIGAVIALFAVLVTTATLVAQKMAEDVQEASQKTNTRLEEMGKAFQDYGQKIESASGKLDGFNTRLFQTEEEQTKLENDLRSIQNSITEITAKASEERRNLTDAEIKKIEEYFAKLQELRDKQIKIQQEIGKAIEDQAKTDLSNFEGNFDKYTERTSEWIATVKDNAETTKNLAKTSATEQIAILNQQYKEEDRLNNKAYKDAYDAIVKKRDETIRVEEDRVNKIIGLSQEGYDNQLSLDKESIKTSFEASEALNTYVNKFKDAKEKQGVYMLDMIANYGKYKDGIVENENIITQNLDENTIKQIGTWARNLEEFKKTGGEITNENKEIAEMIIAIYDNLGKQAPESMKEVVDSLRDTIKDNKNSVTAEAESMMNGVELEYNEGLDDILSNLIGRKIEFKNAGDGQVQAYVDGIKTGEPVAESEMAKLASDAIKEVSKQQTGATTAGEDLIRGINSGLGNRAIQGNALGTIWNFGQRLLSNLKSSLQEQSPSKATKEMGKFLIQGFNLGIKGSQKDVFKTIDSFGDEVVNKMSNAVTLETGKINAKAMLTSNINKTIQINASFDGNVELDNRKVGRIVAPDVSRAIKAGGL